MEDKTELLYNSLFESGDYTKSFEEFQAQFSTEENVGLLYSSLNKSGLYTKTPQEFSEQFFPNLGLKKKDEPMESTSESGSSDSFEGTPEDSFLNTPVTPPLEGEAVADAQAVNYGVPREGQSDLDFDEEVAVKNARKRDAADTRDLFDRSLDVIDKRQHEQDMKVGLNFKDRDFTGRPITDLETDEVVSEMAYNFGGYGFKFEHAKGALGYETVGDIMTVTSPDGNHTENIELDNWTNATDSAEAKKLRKFMEKYKPIDGLEKIQKEAIERDRKVLGKKDYDERMLDIQVDTRNLKDKLNAVVARKEESDILEKELMAMSDEDFAKNIGVYQAWKAEKDKISVDAEEVKIEWEGMAARGKELDRVVGDYTAMRAEGGNFFGGLVNEFWSSGFGRMFAAINDTAIDAISMSMPAGYKDIWAKYQKGMLNGAMKDNPFSHAAREFIPQDRKGTSQLIRERGTAVAQAMGSGTSQEYVDDVGFVQGAIYGVGGSIPAMVTGLPGLVAQGVDFVNQETENNPNFEGITEIEKFAIAAPMGIVMGFLEKLGLTRAIAGKSGVTTIVLKLLQKYKITPGTKTFTEYVDTEIRNGGSRLLLRLTASTMSEFETGGLQEISDIAFKEVYDIMKDEKMFDTPETIGEGLSQVWWGAVAEAIGGFVMGTPGAVNSALTKGKITDLSDGEYEAFEKVMEDENLRGAYAEKLKQDVLSGKKSQQEALDEWNESEKVKGDMGRIPDYYTSEQKKKALELLIRKSELQDIVDKGEKQLVTKEQAEIDAIDAEMTAMSTETDTSSTTETDADGNTITNTVTVDEASAKIKLQEEGIKDPTQEQVDAKQAEMLEEGISQENLSAIDNLAKNTDSSGRLENRNKDLFEETQETSQGSAVLSDITESNENGVATGTYTNTETGDVDVVVSSKGKSDFVSFSRIYEDGKPTNSWSSKMINEAGSDFVTMLTEAQKLLPEGHQWTESKSISESGLGVWNKALKKGYEAQVDSEGNVITKSVTLNEAEKGKSTSDSSDFNDVIVETKSEADAKIKELEGIYPGIVAKPVRVRDGKGRIKGFSFKVELPVLVKGKTETKEDMDVTVDKAREGDVEAQKKLDKYGLKWAKETIYRFVGKSEVDALEKGETIEGKSKAAGVDVTSSSEVTSASDADYRITFKEEGFDDKKKGSRVRMKSEKDGWVKDGYNKSDVLKIEKKNDDGTYETVYDSEAEVEAEVEVDVATQIKNLQTEAKAFIAAEKSKSSKGLPAYSKEFIQEDKKRREEIKRLKGLIAKKTPKKKPAAKVVKKPAVKKAAPKKKAKVKSVQEEEAPKKRLVVPRQGESIQDAIRRTRVANKTKDKSEPPKVETVATVAPYFNTTIKTLEEAKTLRQKKNYKEYKKSLVSIGKALGTEAEVEETVGGYKNDAGEEIVEISNRVVLKDASLEQAEEYAALMAALTPEVQEATIAAQYINQGSSTHNANEYSISVSNKQAAIDALKAAGITDYTFNETTGEVTFIDVLDSNDKSLQDKIGIFVEELEAKKINYENKGYRPIASSYIDASKRKEILRGINGKRAESRQGGDVLRKAVNKAIGRDAKFQGITAKEYKKQITQDEQTEAPPESGPVAGNRLFNEPISAIAEIADRYYQRAFGTKRPNFKGTKKLDKVKAKKISDAFEAMKHSPNNPKVREAYNALVKESIAQYKTLLDAGYVVEINNEDPYASSQEMIDDLRNNKRIKIFSTETGFGDTPITPKQRKENPLLATTTFTDVNGKPMLVNDLFRAIHDFFGHAELGNSFGPIGEENAWNVHARMYSPLARRAMTTETRGQNSYVNFSGINEKIDKIRKKARKLREEGKYKEALKLTNDIYENTFFADQKVGLLPEEFSQISEEEKKVVRTAKPLTKKEEEAAEAEFIKIAGKPKSKKRAAWVKKQNEKAAYIKKQNEKARFRLKTKAAEDSESNPSEVKKFLSFLNLSFPNVTISTNLKEFNEIIETDGVKAYLKGDEILYGVTTEGDIYINPDTNNSDSELYNTAIHEMSHIWTDYLETTEKGREILAKGIELVKKTEIYQEQLEEFDGDTEAAAKEALSILIGNKGQTIAKSSIKSRFEKWLRGVWNYIKKKFKVSTKTKVEDLTLDEFIDLSLSDILGGKEIKTTPEQREAMRSLAKFSKKGSKSELTKLKNIVVKAIKDIRAQGKSEAAIKTLLENRGISSELVSELMAKEKGTTKISVSPTEETNKGYNKLTSAIDAIIAKGYENGTSPVQIATEAISFLQDSKVYKSEKTEDIEREQMLRDLRKRFSMRETSSPSVKKILGEVTSEKISITEANLLKAQIKALNRGAKDMKSISDKASKVLAKEVEKLVKKGSITTNQSAKILARFAKTDVTNDTQVNGFVDYITNIYNKSEDAYRNSLIVKIQKLIKKNTKVTRTAANRIKGKGLDAESQQFFAAMNRVLDGILKTKSEEINEKDFTKKFFPDIEVILQKDPNSLTTKENSQLFAYMSFNSLKGIRNMTLEEVEQLLEDVKLGTKGGRSDLQAKRMAEKAEMDELRVEADASINEGYKGLLNPDGTYINRNRINDKSENTKRIKARNRSVLEDIKVWKENYIFTDLSKWIESLGSNLKNLKTLTNSLDKEGNFFDKNVHAPLRKMETETIKGIESEKINKLDEIASSIKGVKNYNAILKLLSKGINSKVEGLTDSEGNPAENDMFPLDILLRWYALSKNEVQRKKLLKQGFTEEKLAEIKVELGPELVEFADKVIEYLSSPYFETINKVYKLVNNVNLVQIENYFPTQSVLDAVSSSLIQEGDWNAVLSKMNEGATKLRTNTKGDVLLTATDFTTALESHLEEMERYKAYAEGSLKLEKIFKFPSVNSLLNTLGVMQSVKNAINFAINPDGGKAAIQANGIDKLMTQYTGFALATKIMQIGKQATSAIWAFEKYNFRGKDKTRIPGVDLTMYMVDTAEVIATFPFQLAKAYKMSAVLRDRFRKAFKGDVRGLESGSRVAKEQRRTRASIWKKLLRFGLGSTTTIGDIMGVMGYMATYNRDIRNGMDPEVALAKFEEFNETQQSRMNLDKNPIQMKSNYLVRGFTMFGSTLFLAINKVMQGTTNIQRGMRKFLKTGKAKDLPSQEEFRAVFLALGVANVFFTAMANAFKYISGDDDDQEEVMQRLKDAMIGLNLIYQIPYVGSTVEEAVNESRGIYRPGDSVVNPLTSIFRKWTRLQKKAEQSGKDSDYKAAENALRIAFEMYSGTQLDFFEGIYDSFDGDFSEEDMYRVLGVSSSYRPKNSGSSNTESKPKKKTKEKSKSDSFDNDGFDEGFGNDGFDDEGF